MEVSGETADCIFSNKFWFTNTIHQIPKMYKIIYTYAKLNSTKISPIIIDSFFFKFDKENWELVKDLISYDLIDVWTAGGK